MCKQLVEHPNCRSLVLSASNVRGDKQVRRLLLGTDEDGQRAVHRHVGCVVPLVRDDAGSDTVSVLLATGSTLTFRVHDPLALLSRRPGSSTAAAISTVSANIATNISGRQHIAMSRRAAASAKCAAQPLRRCQVAVPDLYATRHARFWSLLRTRDCWLQHTLHKSRSNCLHLRVVAALWLPYGEHFKRTSAHALAPSLSPKRSHESSSDSCFHQS